VTEAQLQQLIVQYAQVRGWLVTHNRKSTITRRDGSTIHATALTGDPGAPDLLLMRNGRHAHLEVKGEKGQISEGGYNKKGQWVTGQLEWLNQAVGDLRLTKDDWRSRGAIPDGAACHYNGGWVSLDRAGSWHVLVAVVRPRHKDWILEILK